MFQSCVTQSIALVDKGRYFILSPAAPACVYHKTGLLRGIGLHLRFFNRLPKYLRPGTPPENPGTDTHVEALAQRI